ncbi:MAG: hypothetical protein AAF747_07400 [Planctomycetota bacterium]
MTTSNTNDNQPRKEADPIEAQLGNFSLTSGLEVDAPAAKKRKTRDSKTIAQRIAAWWQARVWQHKQGRLATYAAFVVMMSVGSASAYLVLRPVPTPDYMDDPLADVLDYTLLTPDFNNLPVERRIELLGELVRRLGDLDTGGSLAMAQFAAAIEGPMREQLEENMNRLVIDAVDMFASEYQDVPAEDREEFLNQAMVRMVRLAEPFDPGLADVSDEEILEDARRDARRNAQAMERGWVSPNQASRMLAFGFRRGTQSSNFKEQNRMMVFGRDLTRQLRQAPENEEAPTNDGQDGEQDADQNEPSDADNNWDGGEG